jgi:plasmid stability protein
MANLSVRNLDDTTVDILRRQAASLGISMEEHVRRVLSQSVANDNIGLGTLAKRMLSEPWDGPPMVLPADEPIVPIDLGE